MQLRRILNTSWTIIIECMTSKMNKTCNLHVADCNAMHDLRKKFADRGYIDGYNDGCDCKLTERLSQVLILVERLLWFRDCCSLEILKNSFKQVFSCYFMMKLSLIMKRYFSPCVPLRCRASNGSVGHGSMGQMGHKNEMGHMGHGSMGVTHRPTNPRWETIVFQLAH